MQYGTSWLLSEVADEQKRQRCELLEELLVNRPSLKELLEYRGQFDLMMSKQNETDELISTLQRDVYSIKSSMHEIKLTEWKLEELQAFYESE